MVTRPEELTIDLRRVRVLPAEPAERQGVTAEALITGEDSADRPAGGSG
jgi:hypothetical protein